MHSDEVHDQYCSVNTIQMIKTRMMSWAGNVSCLGQRRGTYRVLVAKPEINGPLCRPRLRWEGNIRIDLKEIGWEGRECTDLPQDKDEKQAVVNMTMKLWGPIKCEEYLD